MHVARFRKVLTFALVTILAASPAFAASVAQPVVGPAVATLATVSGPYGHLDMYRTSAGRKGLRGSVSDGHGDASFDFDGETLILSDGYTLAAQVLTDNNAEAVARVVATAPDGRTATSILRYNKRNGERSTAGLREVRALTGDSSAFRTVTAALPLFVANAHGQQQYSVSSTCPMT